jgi:signal transduction histidine kinase
LWFRRNCVLDLWLLVLSSTLVLEVTMSSLLAAGRFDVGWYASRVFSLAASIVVLIVLLSETTTLYANLARSVLRQRAVREARQTAMDAMAASIAHEVHQPLGSIVLNAEAALQCLTRARPDVDEARAALQDVIDDAHRAGEVTFGIRSMFKKGASGRLSLDANDLMREVLDMVELDLRKHRVSVATDLRTGLPPLLADRGQLRQVFLNLIVNAIEAMESLTDRARNLRVSSDVVREPFRGCDRRGRLWHRDKGRGQGSYLRAVRYDEVRRNRNRTSHFSVDYRVPSWDPSSIRQQALRDDLSRHFAE